MLNEIKKLAELNRNAKTAEEKEAIRFEMKKLEKENPEEYKTSLETLIKATANAVEELTMAERLGEVTKIISMSYLAKNYFGKTRSWMAQKLNGNVVNGKISRFSDSEIEIMKCALEDISKTINAIKSTL